MGRTPPHATGLYDPRNEHDACGVGMVAHIKGKKSHAIVTQALEILANLDHRGAVGADPLLGDGAGILLQIPDPLFRKWAQSEGKNCPRRAITRSPCASYHLRIKRLISSPNSSNASQKRKASV